MSWVCTRALRSMTSSPWRELRLARRCGPGGCAPSPGWRSAAFAARARASRGTRPSSRSRARPRRARTARSRAAAVAPRRPSACLEQARVVDGDRGLGGDADDEALGALGEHAGSGCPKKRPPMTSPDRETDGHGQVAPHGQVPGRHAVVRRHLAVARVLRARRRSGSVPSPRKVGPEQRGRARLRRTARRPRAARRTSVYSMKASPLASVDVVEERPEPRAAELGRRVGDRLEERRQVELGGQRRRRSGSAARGSGSRRAAPLRARRYAVMSRKLHTRPGIPPVDRLDRGVPLEHPSVGELEHVEALARATSA